LSFLTKILVSVCVSVSHTQPSMMSPF